MSGQGMSRSYSHAPSILPSSRLGSDKASSATQQGREKQSHLQLSHCLLRILLLELLLLQLAVLLSQFIHQPGAVLTQFVQFSCLPRSISNSNSQSSIKCYICSQRAVLSFTHPALPQERDEVWNAACQHSSYNLKPETKGKSISHKHQLLQNV